MSIGPFRYGTELIHFALGDPRLDKSDSALRVLGTIVHHGAGTGHCYLTDAGIARHNRISDRTVQRSVKKLLALGYLRLDRGDRRGRRATDYYLPIDPNLRDRPEGSPPPDDRPRNGDETGHNGVRIRRDETGQPGPRNRTTGAEKPDNRGRETGHNGVPPTSNEQGSEQGLNKNTELDLASPKGGKRAEAQPRGIPASPIPHEGATLPELVIHAADHGPSVGHEVIRRMAVRMGVNPKEKAPAIGKYVWPVARGEVPEERLLIAARWAEKAIDPRMVADKPPLDGFLLIASGQDDLPWPIDRNSEAVAAHRRDADAPKHADAYRPAPALVGFSGALAEGMAVPPRRISNPDDQARQLGEVQHRTHVRPRSPVAKGRGRPLSLSKEELEKALEERPDDGILAAELARRWPRREQAGPGHTNPEMPSEPLQAASDAADDRPGSGDTVSLSA